MKRFAVILAVVSTLFYIGCAGNNTPAGSPASLSKSETGLGIKYARHFNIDYLDDGVKLVTDSAGSRLLLVPEGVNAPPGYAGAVQIKTPISRAMYSSTVYVGFLGALENDSLYDSVIAVCTPEEYWTTPQILERFKKGLIHYVLCGNTTVVNIEEVAGIKPSFVFTGGSNDASDRQFRSLLSELNIKHAVVMTGNEEGHAGALEWIKFFAAFFNLDKEADRIFEAKLAQLDELYEKAANVSDRPTVAYGLIWRGLVYSQTGSSTAAQQIEKAGGIYVFKDIEGPTDSVIITMEEFLNKGRDADILIYGSLSQYTPNKAFLLGTEPLMAEFKAFKNNKVYIFDQGYYMNSDKVVEKFMDMVSIFHPEMFPGHKLTLYRKLPD